MRFLWQYLQPHRRALVLALLLATINSVFSLMEPQIFRITVDRFVGRASEFATTPFVRGVGLLLLASMGVALISRIAKNIQDYLVNKISQKVGTQLYAKSVAHAFSLPYSVFEDQRSGELLQKLQKARTDAQALIQSSINTFFLSLVGMLFVVTYAFTVHWSIGLVFFSAIPILATIIFTISRKIKHAQQQVVRESAALAGSTTETIRNVELVKSLGLTDQEISRLNTVNDRILKLELQKIIIIRKLTFLQGTTVNATRSGLLLLMYWLIYTNAITLGELFSLFLYSFFVFSPLAELGSVAADYQSSQASMHELDRVLSLPKEKRPEHPKAAGTLSSLEFADVHFTHVQAEQPALRGVSFHVDAGETVAFVGPSGSGKTTILKLLLGLYQPTTGTVRCNTTDLGNVDIEEFRSRVGLVAQETQLFAGTIRENLLFAQPRASDADAKNALEAAAAENVLSRSSRGLDTRIGEGGMKLSGGERQRLAIARALLREPELLIFDEATSSLDSLTERSITETIKKIEETRPQLTTILVAHRLSTVAHADRIYVLEHGKIIEQGTHAELLKNSSLYTALWREQQAANHTAKKPAAG